MFDFLSKLSHQHPSNKQQDSEAKPPISVPRQEQVYVEKQQVVKKSGGSPNKKKKLSLSAQLQAGQTAALPNQILQIFQKIRDQTETNISALALNMIEQQKAAVQRKVYLREMSNTNQQYLQQILIQSSSDNRFVRHGLSEIVDTVAESIYEDIMFSDKYEIHKRNGVNKEQMIWMHGNIRSKIGDLKLQLMNQADKIEEKAYEITNKASVGEDPVKNQQVQLFLKNLQFDKQQRRRQQQQRIAKQRQKRKRNEYMKQLMKEKAQSERHERLVQAHQIKRKIKQQEAAISRKKQQQFRQYLKQHKSKKPLFKKKQQEFEQNIVIKQEQERFRKLLERKQFYGPMSFDDIEDHEQRYEDYKRQQQKMKKAELKLAKQAQRQRISDLEELHKGQFRYYVLKDIVDRKEKMLKDPKKQKLIEQKIKQKVYSLNVKQQHRPKIDPAKQYQLQTLLNTNNRKRSANPVRMRINSSYDGTQPYYMIEQQSERSTITHRIKDTKKEGQRNRRYLKQYLRQKLEKGQIKKQKNEINKSSTIEHKTNYLEEFREQRKSSAFDYKTIDNQISAIKNKEDIRNLKALAQHHDSRAKRLQQKFKHVAHKPEQQVELQNDYLYAIKAKLELVNNFD